MHVFIDSENHYLSHDALELVCCMCILHMYEMCVVMIRTIIYWCTKTRGQQVKIVHADTFVTVRFYTKNRDFSYTQNIP